MVPNLDNAAVKALETLVKYHVSSAPIDPLPILKSMPGVLVLSFAEMADRMGMARDCLISVFASENHDVVTSVMRVDGRLRYLMAYNQRLPFYMLQRSLAHELGHIVLGHDGSRPEAVRDEESLVFARHFLAPRPLIRSIMDAGVPVSVETVGIVTGCYERCLRGIRKTPGAHVPARLNRAVREQFADYVANFVDCRALIPADDDSTPVDWGTYFDNYEE